MDSVQKFLLLKKEIWLVNYFHILNTVYDWAVITLMEETKLIANPTLQEEVSLSMKDKDLLDLSSTWKGISRTITGDIKKLWELGIAYYRGTYDSDINIDDSVSKTFVNRIFTNLETIIPMATSKPAVPVVYPATDTPQSKEYASLHQKVLSALYKKIWMQEKLEKLVRHNQIFSIACLKYGIKEGKITVDYIYPTNLILDPNANGVDDSEYVGERIKVTASELIRHYPDNRKFITQQVGGKLGTPVEVIEWWTDTVAFIEYEGKILSKKKNPHFHYGDKVQVMDEYGVSSEQDVRYNFFENPKKPYIFMQVYNLGNQIPDDTTPLHQSLKLQDNLNRRKRQVWDNAESIGNPIRQFTWFSKDQIGAIQNGFKVGDGIFVAEWQKVDYVSAPPLPSYIMDDMNDSKNEIDNLFGTHSTTRGERNEQETARGREILRAWDEDRQSTIWRAIERILGELYRAMTHMIKVYYVEDQVMPILGKGGTAEYLKISRDNIEDGMEIEVEAWSTLPDDKVAIAQQAVQLKTMWAITTEKLYENLGWENPVEEAKKFHQETAQAQIDAQELEAQWVQKKAIAEQEVSQAPEMMKQINNQIAQIGQPEQAISSQG